MKLFPVMIAMVLVLGISGCGGSKSDTGKNTNSVSGNPLDAPGEYLGALEKGKLAAEKTADLSSVRKAIQMYSVENGKNPASLQELVDEKYLPALPKPPYGMEFKYDPAGGNVSLVQKPK